MKTNSPALAVSGSPTSLVLPRLDKRRPARRGYFWPGESFGTRTDKWDLTGAWIDHTSVLPGVGNHSSRTF
jgi:hypothetical protein